MLSVIIPTYRDWARLKICLSALNKQSYPTDSFEIIIANNDPKDAPPKGFFDGYHFFVTVVDVAQKGSYAARNAGAAAAAGDIFCFTDADCVPDHDWLQMIGRHFSQPDSSSLLLSGEVVMFSEHRPNFNYNFAESYDYFFGIAQKEYAKRNVACTANLSMHRSMFGRVDGFNDRLFSGGDVDFCRRALESNAQFKFDESCFVKHPLRDTFIAVIVKAKRMVGARIKRQGYLKSIGTLLPPFYRLYKIATTYDVPWHLRLKAMVCTFIIKVAQVAEYVALLLKLKRCENR